MGLDIRFHEAVKFVGPHPTEWVDESGGVHYCDHETAYTSGSFPRTEKGIPSGVHFDSVGKSLHWNMNYRSYSMFRACLLYTVRPDLVTAHDPYYPRVWTDEITDEDFQTWPFNELIWFSDAEGTYGYEVARKLLGDFRQQEHLIETAVDHIWPRLTQQFVQSYERYTKGLELVGPDGIVRYA